MIVIDSEFESLIPPLTEDEYQRLERSLVTNGWQDWREPIITWNGTIIDGHNRYHACDEHGIEFKTREMNFQSRDDAKLWIIGHQLERRNLPLAAIGDLKLEEKEIVARQARERHAANGGDHGNQHTGGKVAATPNLGEPPNKHDGETLEQLAKEIPLGRESLRKLDVIKRKAKEGDPVAIEEREALMSGEKKSIHGAYIKVTGKEPSRKTADLVNEDGLITCVMCGEPIREGEAHPARRTVHKKCEVEYQHDWRREKSQQKKNGGEPKKPEQPITIGNVDEVIEHDKAELKRQLLLDARGAWGNLQATITRYRSMGVTITEDETSGIRDAIEALATAIEAIEEG